MADLINMFPLSVFRDRLEVDPAYRAELVDQILAMEGSELLKQPGKAWTGDVNGFEFLHRRESFKALFESFSAPLAGYLSRLAIDPAKVDLYYTRAWATIARQRENIAPHVHPQSQISLVYYLKKPPGSGGLVFLDDDPPNELTGGLFNSQMFDRKVLVKRDIVNMKQGILDAQEDEVVIFPSKVQHATQGNSTGEPRLSIAADIVITLKEQVSVEFLMPSVGEWVKVG
ncbi:MAG: putative 2OG-Fe(II) oxygenase [Pseudomonadota bacterium]